MTSGTRAQRRPSRLRRVLRWLPRRLARNRQRRFDRLFWGLIHDHNWLQYDPPKGKP